MSKVIKVFGVTVFLTVSLLGCYSDEPAIPRFPDGRVEGYRPLYAQPNELSIEFQVPRTLYDPGKIYRIDKFILIVEKRKGIHVFNNSDPSKPMAIGFLRVAGIEDVAVRGTTLYADHLSDLVAIDISNFNSIKEISRSRQASWQQNFPPAGSKYFECVDTAKGTVIGWEFTTLTNPKCFR
jgi:hypothetical protein